MPRDILLKFIVIYPLFLLAIIILLTYLSIPSNIIYKSANANYLHIGGNNEKENFFRGIIRFNRKYDHRMWRIK